MILGIAFGLMGGLSLVHSNPVAAAQANTNADFEIQPILAEEQIDASNNYFDVTYKPGSTHTIAMRVQNFTDHKITVKSDLQNAMTQVGGGMSYQPASEPNDPSLKIPLTKIGAVKKSAQTIHLGPQETTIVEAVIKMPSEKFNGMIAGSWHFIEYGDGKNGTNQGLTSNYAYQTGIIIRGSHYKVYPELKYNKTEPILRNNRPAMGIKLSNVQPMRIKEAHIKAVVSRKGLFSDKRIFETSGTSIAPSSAVTIPISWNYDNLKAGSYTVAIKVTGENQWNKLPMTWSFKKNFKVSKKAAAEINKRAVQRPTNKWLYAMTASGALLLVAAFGLYKVIRIE